MAELNRTKYFVGIVCRADSYVLAGWLLHSSDMFVDKSSCVRFAQRRLPFSLLLKQIIEIAKAKPNLVACRDVVIARNMRLVTGCTPNLSVAGFQMSSVVVLYTS